MTVFSSTPLCVYHAQCPDGFAAAWIIRQWCDDGGCDFHPGVYGEDPPPVADRDVILADFTYDQTTMLRIAAAARTVTVLDLHRTAIDNCGGLADLGATVVLDMNRSGATIAWDYFQPVWGKAITFDACARDVYGYHPDYRPAWVNFTEDRDLWRFRYDETRDWFAVATSYPYTFEAWDDMLDRPMRELLIEGAAINRYRDQLIDQAAATAAHQEVAGIVMPVVNCPYAYASDVAGMLATISPGGVAAYYTDSVVDQTRHWGLRSTADGPDVEVLAKAVGGGGHKHASGFRTPLAPDVD